MKYYCVYNLLGFFIALIICPISLDGSEICPTALSVNCNIDYPVDKVKFEINEKNGEMIIFEKQIETKIYFYRRIELTRFESHKCQNSQYI